MAARAKKSPFKRLTGWARTHTVPLIAAAVIAVAGITAVSIFAAPVRPGTDTSKIDSHPDLGGPAGGRPGGSNIDRPKEGTNQGGPGGGHPGNSGSSGSSSSSNSGSNGSSSSGGSSSQSSVDSKKNKQEIKKTQKEISEAKKSIKKWEKTAKNREKAIKTLEKKQKELRQRFLAENGQCTSGLESARPQHCAAARTIASVYASNAKTIKNERGNLLGDRNSLSHARARLNAAQKKLDKLKGKSSKSGGKPGSSGSSGGSGGGSSSGSSGSSGGNANNTSKSDKNQAKVGSLQVTVLKERPGQTPIKLGKVRVSVTPKCKAALKRSTQKGLATFPGCKAGSHTVTIHPPQGFRTVSGKVTQEVTVKAGKQRKIKFILKPTVVATPKPSTSPTVKPSGSPTAVPGTTDNSGQDQAQTGDITDGGDVSGEVKGAGSLPTTGQAALIALITILVISGAYYGFRAYRHRRSISGGTDE